MIYNNICSDCGCVLYFVGCLVTFFCFCFFFPCCGLVVVGVGVADGGGGCGWLLKFVVDVFIIILMSYLYYFNQIAKCIDSLMFV